MFSRDSRQGKKLLKGKRAESPLVAPRRPVKVWCAGGPRALVSAARAPARTVRAAPCSLAGRPASERIWNLSLLAQRVFGFGVSTNLSSLRTLIPVCHQRVLGPSGRWGYRFASPTSGYELIMHPHEGNELVTQSTVMFN